MIADYAGARASSIRSSRAPERYSPLEVLLAFYGYAVQIYADFSGYTDIAIGIALLLGFTLPAELRPPVQRAKSLQDFWRRWHMTLSRWLRDYLYIPLGGSRHGRARASQSLADDAARRPLARRELGVRRVRAIHGTGWSSSAS